MYCMLFLLCSYRICVENTVSVFSVYVYFVCLSDLIYRILVGFSLELIIFVGVFGIDSCEFK